MDEIQALKIEELRHQKMIFKGHYMKRDKKAVSNYICNMYVYLIISGGSGLRFTQNKSQS